MHRAAAADVAAQSGPEVAIRRAELERVNGVQSDLLRAAARLVKSGGRLVYATCSVLSVEIRTCWPAFCPSTRSLRWYRPPRCLRSQGVEVEHSERFAPWFVMLPHLHDTDGFFRGGPGET